MVTEQNSVVKHLMLSNRWQLCKIYKKDNRKRFCGYRDGHWSSAATNKVDGCTSHDTVASVIRKHSDAKDYSLYRTYYIAENDSIIGIDIDKVTNAFLSAPFVIPFPVLDYFVEYSPSRTGLHIWCLVTSEVKQQVIEKFDYRGIVVDKQVPNCKQVEYRIAKCLLTVTGIKAPSTFNVETALSVDTASFYDAYGTIVNDCIESSEVFSKAFSGDYTEDELLKFNEQGLSEYLFSLARVIYQRTGGSTDTDLYYNILSRLPIVRCHKKWAESKLLRWCETNTTFNSIERVEKEKAAILPDISEKQLEEITDSPQPLIIDPKTPDPLLVPLFYNQNLNIFPVSNGFYRYVESLHHYVLYSKAEITAFAAEFYRNSVPARSISALKHLASMSVDYLVLQYTQVGSIKDVIFPDCVYADTVHNANHTYLHIKDAIYDIEGDSFYDETASFLSTSKLNIPKASLEHCFNSYADIYSQSSWKAFLESSFNHDTETIESLQRFFGYVISKDYEAQKALVLRGEAGSGKGTLISVISEVLNATVASTSMQQMDEKFGYSTCLNKKLLVFPEMPRNMRKYHGAWERLKALISADPVSVELKGQQAFSTVLKTKVIICSNYDLSYDGDMNSLNRRLVYCTLPQSFGGNKELEVDYRSLLSTPEEQALILAWIIEGYKLYKKSGLMQSSKGKSALEDATEDTDLIADFIKHELIIVSPDDNETFMSSFINNNEIKTAFKRFCMNNNIQNTFSDRFLPTKIKSYIAKKLSVATTILDMRTSDSRGIRGVKFKDANNYEDPPF